MWGALKYGKYFNILNTCWKTLKKKKNRKANKKAPPHRNKDIKQITFFFEDEWN